MSDTGSTVDPSHPSNSNANCAALAPIQLGVCKHTTVSSMERRRRYATCAGSGSRDHPRCFNIEGIPRASAQLVTVNRPNSRSVPSSHHRRRHRQPDRASHNAKAPKSGNYSVGRKLLAGRTSRRRQPDRASRRVRAARSGNYADPKTLARRTYRHRRPDRASESVGALS